MPGLRLLNNERTFGVELEVVHCQPDDVAYWLNEAGVTCRNEGYNHSVRNFWKATTDGSLSERGDDRSGTELVSPPLMGDEGLRQIREVCRVLRANNVRVNRTCGFHVHHDARDLSLNGWRLLSKLYAKYEPLLDGLMPPSRRESQNQYCFSLLSRFQDYGWGQGDEHNTYEAKLARCFATLDAAETVEAVASAISGRNRYCKLNWEPFWRQGTVEFRQHAGTFNAEKVIAWVVLTQAMLEKAKTGVRCSPTTEPTWESFFRIFPRCAARGELERFYRARCIALGTRTFTEAQAEEVAVAAAAEDTLAEGENGPFPRTSGGVRPAVTDPFSETPYEAFTERISDLRARHVSLSATMRQAAAQANREHRSIDAAEINARRERVSRTVNSYLEHAAASLQEAHRQAQRVRYRSARSELERVEIHLRGAARQLEAEERRMLVGHPSPERDSSTGTAANTSQTQGVLVGLEAQLGLLEVQLQDRTRQLVRRQAQLNTRGAYGEAQSVSRFRNTLESAGGNALRAARLHLEAAREHGRNADLGRQRNAEGAAQLCLNHAERLVATPVLETLPAPNFATFQALEITMQPEPSLAAVTADTAPPRNALTATPRNVRSIEFHPEPEEDDPFNLLFSEDDEE